MRKKRILFCGEATYLNTGYATYGREVMKRLYQSGKYELAEFASYGEHKDNTENVFKLSLANHFYEMVSNSKLILEYTGNSDLGEKINMFLEVLKYKPNRIAYKQKIVADLYKYKKYYLD